MIIRSNDKRRRHRSATRGRRHFIWIVPLAAVLIASGAMIAYGQYVRSMPVTRSECVILVHGLLRSAASMALIEHRLIREGYRVINIDYASTRTAIPAVAEDKVAAAVEKAGADGCRRIHMVTHSLGAVIVRSYLQDHQLPQGSRIVMLAPPNQGSELADWAKENFPRLFELAGPAAAELGTEGDTLTSRLKPITPEVGIIIGKDSWNPLFSRILPGRDDGAVTVERARLREMQDFLVAPCNHTSILLDHNVREQVIHFLQKGRFR